MDKQVLGRLGGLSWRERIHLVNSVLFCVIGGILIARFLLTSAPGAAALLGTLLLGFGAYRLVMAGKELRKRNQTDE